MTDFRNRLAYLWMLARNPRILLTRLAFGFVRRSMAGDQGWAWSWHCNLAVPIWDGGVSHQKANEIAARIMYTAFDIDTSKFPEFEAFKPYWAKESAT